METTAKTKWTIDPSHSEIGFKVRHLMMTNVKGTFKVYDASIYTTGTDFMTSEIDFWMDPASVDTGDEKRDGHLKSADFFDAETHKEITFSGNTYEKTDTQGKYILWGDLTVKGITKRIKLNVEVLGAMKDPYGNQKVGFVIDGKINRKDWGLVWNVGLEAGGVLVSEEVTINCEVQLIQKTS